jgi:hypothetical protein
MHPNFVQPKRAASVRAFNKNTCKKLAIDIKAKQLTQTVSNENTLFPEAETVTEGHQKVFYENQKKR